MAGITLNAGSCVRAASKESTCTLCEVICPTEAIKITEMLPSINLSECVGCGGCVGVCPTEALKLDEFSVTEFFFEFAAEEENLLSCRKNLPCISVLNVEHLIALASLKGELLLDMGHCSGCAVASTCEPQIRANAEEADYLLEAMEIDGSVTLKDIRYEEDASQNEQKSGRRGFFGAFTLKNAVKVKSDFEREVEVATDERLEHTLGSEDIQKMRNKGISDKRKLLFTALKRVEKPSTYHVVDANELSFTSQKLLDADSCTACQMCYRVCPTGALSSDMKNSKIDFDPLMCVKCHLCHDVCEPECLTLSDSYSIKEFFEPVIQRLATFKIRQCDECGTPYAALKGKRLCYRCEIEEQEARDLWGIVDE